jgi:hypothetical protein
MPIEFREVHGKQVPVYTVGTKVQTVDTIKSKYRSRVGTIVSVNLEIFDQYGKRPEIKRSHHLEYGLNFKENLKPKDLTKTRTDAWFLPTEINERT